jgi:hypothetical protein
MGRNLGSRDVLGISKALVRLKFNDGSSYAYISVGLLLRDPFGWEIAVKFAFNYCITPTIAQNQPNDRAYYGRNCGRKVEREVDLNLVNK